MNYYQVSRTSEPKIVGVTTGASQVALNEEAIENNDDYKAFLNYFDYQNKDFWTKQNTVCQLNPPIIKGKMRKKAKLTDIMEYGPIYHCLHDVYSQKYIDIIKTFNIGNYKTFDFEIESIKEKYYLLYIETISTPEIIFDKSIICTGHKMLNNKKYYPVENYPEFLELLKTQPLATYEKIAISKEHYGKDIIPIQSTAMDFYSEKLIDFLLDCRITGLQVKYNNSIQLEFV